jgi:hypothetical protein
LWISSAACPSYEHNDRNREIISQAFLDFPYHFHRKARPVFNASTVGIRAFVPERRKEIVQQMTAGSIDIDAVESRFLSAYRSACELVHNFLNFFDSQGMGLFRVKVSLELKTDGRSADRFSVIHRFRHKRKFDLPWAVMIHLHKCRATVFVDYGNQFAEALNIPVIVDAIPLSPADTARIIDRGRLHDEKANAAACDSLIKGQNLRTHMHVVLMPHKHAGA